MNSISLRKSYIYSENYRVFCSGIHDGFPIGLGYFAVAFSLGIAAKNAGLTAFQGFLASLLVNASAGEYAAFTVIGNDATYYEMMMIILIANARYLLMSGAMSQRMNPCTPIYHRFLIGFHVTDELFGIAIARPGYLNPYYSYGAVLVAAPCWAIGTAIGVITGNLLSLRFVSALSVALYGMFLAVIIPPARKNKVIAALVLICFVASYLASCVPMFSNLSEGTRTIFLTVAISSVAALLFPVKSSEETEHDA